MPSLEGSRPVQSGETGGDGVLESFDSSPGHGECECGDCSGWTYAWAEWAAERRGGAAVIDADEFQEVHHAFVSAAEEYVAEAERQIEDMRSRGGR